jgi:hypothetical protein
MKRLTVATTLALIATGLLPSLASASTQLGRTVDNAIACGSNNPAAVRWQHAATSAGAPSYTVPAGGGVITSWSTNPGANSGTSTRLEVVREGSPSSVVGESSLQSNIAQHNSAAFPTQIAVQAGDRIGIEIGPTSSVHCATNTPGGDAMYQLPDPGAGNQFSGSPTVQSSWLLDVSATVEPDADHDGFGDETQDLCPTDPTTHGPCPKGGQTQTLAALSGLAFSNKTFAAQNSGPSTTNARKKSPRGTKVSFKLNEAASVRFTVTQRVKGRKVKRGKKTVCVKPTHKNRKRKRCTRVVTLKGSFSRTGVAGKNSFHFSGRLNGRKLKPGRYRLVATPTAGGKRGKPTSSGFRIVR